jgi:hypothetical protein
MRLGRFAVLAMVVVPVVLAGQGGRGERPAGGRGRGAPQQQGPPQLKAGDFDQLSPAKVAVDHRLTLALDDAKAHRLDSIAIAFSAETKNFARALDTLQNAMRVPRDLGEYEARVSRTDTRDKPKTKKDTLDRARNDSLDRVKFDAMGERILAARRGMTAELLTIRGTYDTYLASTTAVLDDEQRTKLGPWLQAASEELTKRLRWVNQR